MYVHVDLSKVLFCCQPLTYLSLLTLIKCARVDVTD